VCECVYVCMCACVLMCVHMCMCVIIIQCVCVVSVHLWARMRARMYVCERGVFSRALSLSLSLCTCVCVFMCVHMYICETIQETRFSFCVRGGCVSAFVSARERACMCVHVSP